MASLIPDRKEMSSGYRRYRYVLGAIVLIALILGLISLARISSRQITGAWDGAFPDGEFLLNIRTQAGEPVKGAVLSTDDPYAAALFSTTVVDKSGSRTTLISNDEGVIIILHVHEGFEVGGVCWNLFWVFPMCSPADQYDFQISAPQYKTIRLSTKELFAPAYKDAEKGITYVYVREGEIKQIPVYELTFTLKDEN